MYLAPGWLHSCITLERCATISLMFCSFGSLEIACKLLRDDLNNCLPTFLESSMAGLSSVSSSVRERTVDAICLQYDIARRNSKKDEWRKLFSWQNGWHVLVRSELHTPKGVS